MSRPKSLAPAYCHHKQSGRGYVSLDGRQRMLPGPYGSDESRGAYDRLVAEWLSNGRTMAGAPSTGPTVSMIALAFWKYAETRYVKPDGTPTGEAENYRLALRVLRRLYGPTPAVAFGPKRLKLLRQQALAETEDVDPATGQKVKRPGWCRNYANRQVKRIQQVFRWAASEELIPESAAAALGTVGGLREGMEGARESEPVGPVDAAVVDDTLPHLPPPVRAMVQLQRLTGARGGELFALRACDLDASGAVWKYRPATHKTKHKGHERVIYFGPQARDVLAPFVRPDVQAFLFQPAEAIRWRYERARTKPADPAAVSRRGCGTRYRRHAYAKAITRACDRAFPPPGDLAQREGETVKAWRSRLTPEERAAVAKWQAEHRWHPHQLRHAAATAYRRAADFESAKIILGHRTDSMTELYAERDDQKAQEIVGRIG